MEEVYFFENIDIKIDPDLTLEENGLLVTMKITKLTNAKELSELSSDGLEKTKKILEILYKKGKLKKTF